ncbi:F-box/kelch-repeat protein SKIP30 [Amborella trichopoda]|uniref:F-box domain-containing protein n=1 Tax=Amborella trichopoda TaxID=13333 RepID=W1P1Z5_AMBTC|nr:F-box/kelch-repeat protein SKIP30 [Amborella trichopoda]ERN01591.1 hypothetical protein AMTR_s00002p00272160 [Amborella trichopoda]|eukprot:XP_006839022.1 F-box/kelch-repeat protein SKIP30 [Amborella trichopoda]
MCLARVPFSSYPTLCLVSHSWRDAIQSPDLFKMRIEVNSTEDFLCVFAAQRENLWQLYDPSRDIWMSLPPLPTTIHRIRWFCTSSEHPLDPLTGGSEHPLDPLTGEIGPPVVTNEVWCYNPAWRQWAQHSPMRSPRHSFACCAWEGRILIAGGFTTGEVEINAAEVYDPVLDVW